MKKLGMVAYVKVGRIKKRGIGLDWSGKKARP
jgi:hypothetical protein